MYLKGGCENGQGLSGGWCLRQERGGLPQKRPCATALGALWGVRWHQGKGPDSAQPRVPGFQAGGLS